MKTKRCREVFEKTIVKEEGGYSIPFISTFTHHSNIDYTQSIDCDNFIVQLAQFHSLWCNFSFDVTIKTQNFLQNSILVSYPHPINKDYHITYNISVFVYLSSLDTSSWDVIGISSVLFWVFDYYKISIIVIISLIYHLPPISLLVLCYTKPPPGKTQQKFIVTLNQKQQNKVYNQPINQCINQSLNPLQYWNISIDGPIWYHFKTAL